MAIADTSEITLEELQLSGRNHSIPLEALKHDITPIGLHYLLIHFDIPKVDAETWQLEVGGLVEKPLALTLADVKARPARTMPVTLECAGNGRALIEPRPLSQPWLEGAVGTAEWTGTPLAPLLEEAGLAAEAKEVVFSGLDRGIQGDVEHAYERSLPVAEAQRDEILLAYEINGQPLPPQHGFPLRADRPRLVRDDAREVAQLDHRRGRAVHGLAAGRGLPRARVRGGARRAGHPHQAALAAGAAGDPGVPLADALRRAGPVRDRGTRLVGPGAGLARGVQ